MGRIAELRAKLLAKHVARSVTDFVHASGEVLGIREFYKLKIRNPDDSETLTEGIILI